MNANFQLLKDHVTSALGLADLTGEDLEELAQLVTQIQALAASGELDGTSLEYAWDGTSLGIRREGEEAFTYVDLRGATGPQGERGPGLEYEWTDTQLGVRAAGQTDFEHVDLIGPQGPVGEQGVGGDKGEPGEAGRDGANGRGLEFAWNGTQLGVRYEGDTAFEYIELRGARGPEGQEGPRGEQGEPGPDGQQRIQGIQGIQGAHGLLGPEGPQGATGAAGSNVRGLEYNWDGTQLGVRYEGDSTYEYVDLEGLVGPEGPEGIQGARGERGLPGPGLDVRWQGTTLEVKARDETEWSRVDLKGDPGATGPSGADGRTLHSGSAAPLSTVGRDGDFHIDTSTWSIYGPKQGGAWGAGASLVGTAGPAGKDGAGSLTTSTFSTTHTLPAGTWEETNTFIAQCPAGYILHDVNLQSPNAFIYGLLHSLIPISDTQTEVTLGGHSDPIGITIHVRCLTTTGA